MSTHVWAKLPAEVHEYFFRHVLAGEHKAKQSLTALFWAALYAECQRRQIPPTWSAENSHLVHTIAAQLTFTTNHEDSPDRSRCPVDPAPEHQT